ncbi:MAG: hypothetical protein LAP21_17190 [Acidobacteriia bacterium]|nr:hypothetical protein [Terriglobia bacterium]
MTSSNAPDALTKFHRTPWKFQQTFKTPLKNLLPFVTITISAIQPFKSGQLTIETWVFEPKHLKAVLSSHSISAECQRGQCVTAVSEDEAAQLLEAALNDWVDFIFIPNPKSFAIYAHHDESTTFFAHTRSGLNRVTGALVAAGFEPITRH